jgi:AcrR family transcriptional regulator
MSKSFTSGSGDPVRKGYHHGNLKEALIAAALDLIAEKGAAGFTFAEAARQAGVSPAAPYRHYRDRDMLMADIALKGFELFAAELAKAWSSGQPKPLDAFLRMGRAYLAFARNEPSYYAAMFESALSMGDHPACLAASDRAFEVLKLGCESLIEQMVPAQKPPALMMASHIWSTSHGIASLFARGDAARRPLPISPEDLLESATLIYLDGLGLKR